MVTSLEDLEAKLLRLDRSYQRLDESTLFVRLAPEQPPVAMRLSPPLVVMQVEIGPPPADEGQQLLLFRRLLEMNGSELVHASYALTSGSIVLGAALEWVSLDANELEAVLSDFDLALAEHVEELRRQSQDPPPASK